jgi:RNA polymerase sigma factor (sigma-70 family)
MTNDKGVLVAVDTSTRAPVAPCARPRAATVVVVAVSPAGMNARRAPTLEDDRLLVSEVLARTPGAFERLVSRFQRLCWHIVGRMVRDREDARDLCQETFLRVHRHLHQYRSESALSSWIGQVAYNTALRYLERKRIPLVAPSREDDDDMAGRMAEVRDDFDLEAASANAELMSALHAAIDELPPLQRTILTLHHLDEVPIGEIATITGIAEGTIKSHLFRSRAKLRDKLETLVRTGSHDIP